MYVGMGSELGDNIYGWPTVRALGIGKIVNLEGAYGRPDWLARSKSLKRLAESQDYISSFEDYRGQSLAIDLSTYRSAGMRYGDTIINRVARWARVSVDQRLPWLSVEPDARTKDRIVVSRCPRWKTYSFPYREIVSLFGRDILFVGTDDEYGSFCGEYGMVERLRCSDMLEIAQAIAGSALFIGNQSSPFAIAEGLKHLSVLEVCPFACDTWTGRPNCTYALDGDLHFSALGKSFRSNVRTESFFIRVGKKYLYGKSEFECETLARASHVIQGIPLPPMMEIRRQIQQTSLAA